MEWKTLKSKTIKVGSDNFVEINLKQPPGGENLLLAISKGWFSQNGDKRYKTNILIRRDKKDNLINAINEVCK